MEHCVYCQAHLSSLSRQSLEQSPCTSHISTIATIFRQHLKTFLFQSSYPDLIIWHFKLTFCCGPGSNFVFLSYLGHIKNLVDDITQ